MIELPDMTISKAIEMLPSGEVPVPLEAIARVSEILATHPTMPFACRALMKEFNNFVDKALREAQEKENHT
jgi:hypothetical protein